MKNVTEATREELTTVLAIAADKYPQAAILTALGLEDGHLAGKAKKGGVTVDWRAELKITDG